MPRRSHILLLLTALSVGPAAAGSNASNSASTPVPIQVANGDDAQRTACTPDVFRLCGQFIPDVNSIVGCLRTQRPNLSPACRAVFR
jgi:hypothetical protein